MLRISNFSFSCPKKLLVGFYLAVVLASCGDSVWLGPPPPPPIPGERIDVFGQFSQQQMPFAAKPIALPEPHVNPSWLVEGGNAQHYIGHPAFDHNMQFLWQKKIGRAASTRRPFHVQPVAYKGILYVVDTRYRIVAVDLKKGTILWHQRLSVPAHDLDAFGGGIAVLPYGSTHQLFVCTGYGTLEVLDIQNGQLLWKKDLPQACHAPPVGNQKKVFVSLIDNKLWAFESHTGNFLWQFTGTPQLTRIGGSATPAVTDSHVFYPLSSGEIIAIDVERGQTVWGDFLIRKNISSFVANLDDVRASPVLAGDDLFALSSSGTAVALKKDTGKHIWKSEISTLQTPWLAGNVLFILDKNRLLAVDKHDGNLFWQTVLPEKDENDRKLGYWHTPVLAGSFIYILNLDGNLLSVRAEDGTIGSFTSLNDTFDTPPLIVEKTLVFLSRKGIVSAMQ